MSTGAVERTKVLIVGAGPAGLALSIELGHRGIPCIVLERHDRVGRAPRAKTTHVRTREHLRRWGIAGHLAAASPLGIDYPSDIIFVTRLSGFKLAHFKNAFHCAPARDPRYSEHAQWIPQYTLEEILRVHAREQLGVRLRFNAEFVSAVQKHDRVISYVRDTERNRDFTIESDYLVGADGARSTVRTLIGARMEGRYGLSRNHNLVFHAPGLAEAHPHGPAIMYWQVNSDLPSLIGPMDRGDTWFFMPTRLPDGMSLTRADASAAIQRATGLNLSFDVVHSDEWIASELIADRYRVQRVFLVGDACHLHPPFGGYGMNMGISDGVDLGWKLAAVIQGWGGMSLLDSYVQERRPTHQFVIAEAVANHAVLADSFSEPGLEDPGEAGARLRTIIGENIIASKAREFHNLGCVLGYRYQSGVIITDGSDARTLDSSQYVPSAQPGCIAPHAWLEDHSSLFDHFGAGFTLLTQRSLDDPEVRCAVEDSRTLGIPLKPFQAPHVVIETLYKRTFTLIRPDQHVAWRGDVWCGKELLCRAAGRNAAA